MHQLSTTSQICACPDCDLLVSRPKINRHHCASCPRCGKVLYKHITNSLDRTLALTLTGLGLYLPAMLLPLVTLSTFGLTDSGNVVETIFFFFSSGYSFVAVMLLLSAGFLPLLLLSFLTIIVFQLKIKKGPSYLPKLFKYYLHLREWAMLEVYLLGIVITIIKMRSDAGITFEPGFFFFLALVIASLATSSVVDKKLFWKKIEALTGSPSPNITIPDEKNYNAKTAGYISCTCCAKLLPEKYSVCPRCSSRVWARTPSSISKTWALIITSTIVFIPANTLPIMQVNYFGIPDRSTILDGIIYFFVDGDYGIGIIILTASILVPIFKVMGLMIILLSIHFKKRGFLRQKSTMFRFIEFIGRWSMLDIFVIALLTVMVDFGFFTSIEVAPAATYFCIVVVSTMFAAITFDPRLLWDTFETNWENND